MSSVRWRKIARDAWLHKSRSLLVIIAIAIGVAGAGTVLDAWSLVRQATRGEYRASNPASATLRLDSVDARTLALLRAEPRLRDVQARRTMIVTALVRGARRTAVLFAFDDPNDVRIGLLAHESGSWPPADGSIVLERSSVDIAGLGVGDSLALQLGEGTPQRLPVSGVARDVGVAPGWMEHVVYGFVTRATLRQLAAPSSLNELQLTLRDRTLDRDGVRRVALDVKALLEREGHAVQSVDVPEPGRHVHAAQIESLLFTQGAFGLLTLIASGLLVINLVAAMLAGQRREIGVMKAMGASGRQIGIMYLALALGLGLIACAVALPLAVVLGRAYARFTADTLNFDVTGFSIPFGVVALQLAVGALLPVLAASIPVAHGCRISVSEALREPGIAARGERPSRLFYLARGLPRPLLLSLRNAFRQRSRMLLTLATLATGGAVYIGALNLRASIRRSVDVIFSAQRYDLGLRLRDTRTPAELEAVVRRMAGVERVEAYGATRASLVDANGSAISAIAMIGVHPSTQMMTPALIAGRWLLDTESTGVVISHRIADGQLSLRVGGTVRVLVGGETRELPIVGVAETGPAAAIYMSRAALAALIDGGRVDRVAVVGASRDVDSLLALAARIRPELAAQGLVVQSSDRPQDNRGVIEDHLLMVADFLGIVAKLMIVVGGLGLAATMSLNVLERSREIGVLRAVGAPHSAIFGMIEAEGLVIAVLSWLVALPLSVPMSVLLGRAFSRIMFDVPVRYLPEGGAAARWLVVVIIVAVVSCAWPAVRAMRITTARALAYE